MYHPTHNFASPSFLPPPNSPFYQGYSKREMPESYPTPQPETDGRLTPKRRRIAGQSARPSGACTRCKRLKVISPLGKVQLDTN